MKRTHNHSPLHTLVGGGMLTLAALTATGCSNAGQGALAGGGIGAAAGAIIGSVFGEAGAGAAIGAVSGAVAGGVIGDQNERRERELYARPHTIVIERNDYYEAPPDPYHHRDRYLRRRGG